MKYTISIAIDGRIDAEVDAVSFEEAVKSKFVCTFIFQLC